MVAPLSVDCPIIHTEATLRSPERFYAYFIDEHHRGVEGWVTSGALSAACAFNGLQRRLGIKGHICEIGVHHGRYFVALSLLRALGERSLAVDVFDMQELNTDQSGCGNLEVFLGHVNERVGRDPDVVVLKADSLTLSSNDVTQALGGRVRLFSIDGSHTVKHTLNDLMIAEQSIVDGGLVVIDDFLNPAWPGVIEAVVCYLQKGHCESSLVPIGYGDNKFYFTTPKYVDQYRAHVEFLSGFATSSSKCVSFFDRDLRFISFRPPREFLKRMKIIPGQRFSCAAPAVVPLLGAVSQSEAAGTWATGAWLGIPLALADCGDSNIRLTFEVTCFRHVRDPLPTLSCFVENRLVASNIFPKGEDEKSIVLDIDRGLFHPGNYVEVWFHNSKAASPASLDLSADGRQLSFLLRAVSLITIPIAT